MVFQIHPYVIALVISSATTFLAGVIVLRRDVPGARSLGGVLLATFIWSSAYALSWWLDDLNEKILGLKIMFFGVIAVPTLFLIFTLEITHRKDWLTFRNYILLAVEPFVILMLVWFNLERVLPKVGIVQEGGFQILQIERGVGFWLNTYYSYGIILLAFFLLGVSALQANHFFRRQYLIILLGSLLPFSFSVFTQISYKIVSELDLAPVAFSLSGVMYVYAMLRYQFMDLLPVARERLIENMSDGVLVLDDQNRIVDINPIMKNFIAVEPSILLGRDVSELPEVWSKELRQLLNGIQTHVEMNLPDNPVRYLDLRITALYNDENLLKGRLIVFRDITDRKDVEKDLRRAMDRLQTQLIEIGLLQSQLREQAIRDSLTSVFNRRYMEETLDRELARAARESYPLCLIMMDLDHFKKVNDTHGHEAGDVVLKALADTIARQSRHGDFVCRYGGEEFVLVMPNITLATARERADELHKMVSSLNIPYGDITLTTTISMGIAMYPNHGDNKADILRAADKAMYIAKNTGRNRIIVYPEPQLSVD